MTNLHAANRLVATKFQSLYLLFYAQVEIVSNVLEHTSLVACRFALVSEARPLPSKVFTLKELNAADGSGPVSRLDLLCQVL